MKEELSLQDYLFGGFLSAVNYFSDEMFSKGLAHAPFGNYKTITVLSLAELEELEEEL